MHANTDNICVHTQVLTRAGWLPSNNIESILVQVMLVLWLSVVGCGSVWLSVVGCGWLWLVVVGCGWLWLVVVECG